MPGLLPDKAITESKDAQHFLKGVAPENIPKWLAGDFTLRNKKEENIFHKLSDLAVAQKFYEKLGDARTKGMLNEIDTDNHVTPLHRLCETSRDTTLIDFYIAKGADINALNADLETPLDIAIRALALETSKESMTARQEVINLLRKHGAKPGDELVDAQQRKTVGKYATFYDQLVGEKADIVIPPPPPLEDLITIFKDVPTLPKVEERGPPVILIVFEKEPELAVRGVPFEHIVKTSSIANSVLRKLTGGDPASGTVIGLQENFEECVPLNDTDIKSPVAALMKRPEVQEGQVIFSRSFGTPDVLVGYIDGKIKGYRKTKVSLERDNPVVYQAANNDQDKFPSRQDMGAEYNLLRTIRVGAVKPDPNHPGYFRSEPYSEEGAAVNGQLMIPTTGTSFTTPVVAALHAAITRRYGQWKDNPYGVTPEEIQQIILRTANKKVIDNTTGKEAQYMLTNAGVRYHDRAGFGVIDPLMADAMAKELFEFKRNGKLSTDLTTQTVVIRQLGHTIKDISDWNGWYNYDICLSNPVWAHNVALDLEFKNTGKNPMEDRNNNRNRTRIAHVAYDGVTYNANLSIIGTATLSSMMGTPLPQGTHLTLQTQQPLSEGTIRIHGMNPDHNAMSAFIANKERKQLNPALDKVLNHLSPIASPFPVLQTPSVPLPQSQNTTGITKGTHASGLPMLPTGNPGAVPGRPR